MTQEAVFNQTWCLLSRLHDKTDFPGDGSRVTEADKVPMQGLSLRTEYPLDLAEV